MKERLRQVLMVCALLVAACAAPPRAVHIAGGEKTISAPGLGSCKDDGGDLTIESDTPLVLLVHGCNSSGERFKTLAQVFEAHGQQTACYNYDDRDSLDDSSAGLVQAIRALEPHLGLEEMTVLGHSQGGLVSRRALIEKRDDGLSVDEGMRIKLVTISSPFNGIEAASHCGSTAMHVLTLGVSAFLCRAISGDKWTEIHGESELVQQPGEVIAWVDSFLKVVTDERDTCRRVADDGSCDEDDYVFSIPEQYNERIDEDERVENVEIKAGHAEIVGVAGEVPVKLIESLQANGVMAPTPEDRQAEVARLLERLYL